MNLLSKLLGSKDLNNTKYYLNGECFIYLLDNKFRLNSCKEVAAFYAYETKDFIAYVPNQQSFDEEFKRVKLLDRRFGLKTKFHICVYGGLKFIVLHNTWYNKNRISRDFARTILKYNQSHPRDCKYANTDSIKNHPIWADPVKYIDNLPQKVIQQAELVTDFGLFKFLAAN